MNHTISSAESPEKQAEYQRMHARLERIFTHPDHGYLSAAADDSLLTFGQLGLSREQSIDLFSAIMKAMKTGFTEKKALPDIEADILKLFRATHVDAKNLVEILDEKLASRAALIHEQVAPFLVGTKGPVLDFGAGDLQVTQMLQDKEHLNIRGVDVRPYRKNTGADKPVPFELYDGKSLPFADHLFEAALATNVLHHAGETPDTHETTNDNEDALRELCRVTANKLVVIETVPDPEFAAKDPAAAMERTFWNDYLYNRLFHSADVPVPGRYETLEHWPKRFQAHGWEMTEMQRLGYDQPTIRDFHVLYVFQRAKRIAGMIAGVQTAINENM